MVRVMKDVPTCLHTERPEPVHEAGGKYCDEHGLELALILALAARPPRPGVDRHLL
jgi:hypothetical protein